MSLSGRTLGNIRVQHKLASGGMGEVYAGFDEKLRRRVALKTIRKRYAADPDARARFLREARVLSNLNHPHICLIYDFLEHEDMDILVLELIDGSRLGEAMRAGLSAADRMRIAREIVDVLIVAHERGIVHRDLKPDNVMLDESGRVKVLDFGLARLIDADAGMGMGMGLDDSRAPDADSEAPGLAASVSDDISSLETVRVSSVPPRSAPDDSESIENRHLETEHGRLMGTVAYMSPEQASGEPATAASDLYSFGLILQELFSGRSAYPPGLSTTALMTRVLEADTVSIAEFGLDPDLARLLERLTSREPGTRPSALDTAMYLEQIQKKPRAARRRRARRAATALSMAAALLMAVLAFFVYREAERANHEAERANHEARRAESQAERARTEAYTAARVTDFLVDLLSSADPMQRGYANISLEALLQHGTAKLDKELEEQPLTRARLSYVLGDVYRNLGEFEAAERLLARSLAIREAERGAHHIEVIESLNGLGILAQRRGEYETAAAYFSRSLAALERQAEPPWRTLSLALNGLGIVSWHQGRFEAAERYLLRALEVVESADDPDLMQLADVLDNTAILYKDMDRLADAEPLYLRALELRLRELGEEHVQVGTSYNNLAELLREQKRFTEAEPMYLRSLAIWKKSYGQEHPAVSVALANIGLLYAELGRLPAAETYLQESLELMEKTVGLDHVWVGYATMGLGLVRYKEQDFAAAESLYQRTFDIWTPTMGADHIEMVALHTRVAELRRATGDLAAAIRDYQRAVEILEKARGATHHSLLEPMRALAEVAREHGDQVMADEYQRRVNTLEP